MKKSIFKVGFLTTLILILLVSCTSVKDEVPVNTLTISSNQKNNDFYIPRDLREVPACVGALHNAGVVAFARYVQRSGLSPYEAWQFNDDMIYAFAENFIDSILPAIIYEFSDCEFFTDTVLVRDFGESINTFVTLGTDVGNINRSIQEYAEQFYEAYCGDYYDEIPYETIKEIAVATNVLWGRDWDYACECFINPDPNYYANRGDDDQSENDEERERKEKEKQDKLKKADIQGAVDGAINGAEWAGQYGWVAGAWGAVAGAALGATVASIREWVHQEMEEAALYMDVDYVVPDSYLYNYLLMLQQTDSDRYYELFGSKFDDILF